MINFNNIKSQVRDKKYYDKFSYGIKFKLPEVSCMRMSLDHNNIDSVLNYRQTIKNTNWGGSWQSTKNITESVRANCHSFSDFLSNRPLEYKFVIYDSDIGHFYTDHLVEVKNLSELSYVKVLDIKQAVLNIPRDCILLKKSDYTYRTYFKNQSQSTEQKNNLVNFLKSRSDIRLCPSLKEYSQKNYKYITDNFFIDYNDSGLITFLTLATSLKIKKTVNIICDK